MKEENIKGITLVALVVTIIILLILAGISINAILQNGGTNILKATSKVDKQCNIFDMAGNCSEWTTETSSHSAYPCVLRGGIYSYSDFYTSNRNNGNTSRGNSYNSFRPLLYL